MNEYIKLAVTQVVVALIAVLSLPVLSWGYEPDVVGQFALVQVTLMLLQTLVGQSLEQGVVRFYYSEGSKESLIKTIFSYGIFCTLLFFSFCFITGINLWGFFLKQTGIELTYQIIFIFYFINCFLILISRMESDGNSFFIISLLQRFCFISVVLYLLWSGKTSNFIQLSYVFLFSLCVQFVIGIFLLRRFLSKVFKAKVDFLLFKRIYRFTFPLFFSAFLSWFIYGAPRYMLGWYSSLDEVALFSMAFGFAGIASLIQGVITTVWTPWFFKNIDNGLEQKKFESIISIAGCFLSGVILITGLCSNFVHLFIPEQYSAIANVILLSVFFPILFTLSELTVVGCYVKNKTKLVMLSSAVSAIVCFLISFALSSKLGALGAAFSMFFSGLVLFIMRTEFSRLVWVRFKIAETYLVIFSTCLLSLASFCFSDLIHKLCYWLALIFTFCIYLYKKDFIGRCVFLFKSE